MNNCVICNENINADSQYINGKWYHNVCIEKQTKEMERLNDIINECSNDILKELKENNHLSYGVALSIRQKLIDYKELKELKESN